MYCVLENNKFCKTFPLAQRVHRKSKFGLRHGIQLIDMSNQCWRDARARCMNFFSKIYEPLRVRRAQTMRHFFITQVYSKSLEIYYSVHSY